MLYCIDRTKNKSDLNRNLNLLSLHYLLFIFLEFRHEFSPSDLDYSTIIRPVVRTRIFFQKSIRFRSKP